MRAAMLSRLGVASAGDDADYALVKALFGFLHATKAPFEQVMFDLYSGSARLEKALQGPAAVHYAHVAFAPLKGALAQFDAALSAQATHPYFRQDAPVTLLYPEIERLWHAIDEKDDWSLFEAKLEEIEMVRGAYGFQSPFVIPDAAKP